MWRNGLDALQKGVGDACDACGNGLQEVWVADHNHLEEGYAGCARLWQCIERCATLQAMTGWAMGSRECVCMCALAAMHCKMREAQQVSVRAMGRVGDACGCRGALIARICKAREAYASRFTCHGALQSVCARALVASQERCGADANAAI